jgi:hypothetical protein
MIIDKKDLTDEVVEKLQGVIKEFKEVYQNGH